MGKRSKKQRAQMYYKAPDEATDDLYEALLSHYWGAQDYARHLLYEVVIKHEQGGYSVKAQPEAQTGAQEVAADNDDTDYDRAAALGDTGGYAWQGWSFHDSRH